MRLDWNCAREILTATESVEDKSAVAPSCIPGFAEDVVLEHMRLLMEAGFIKTLAAKCPGSYLC